LKCPICGREANEKIYCELHAKAYDSVVKKYDQWKKAMGISWKEYLSKIANNPLTGEWAKEVAEYLIENGEN
jgi:cell wall assembly regulator SMI1